MIAELPHYAHDPAIPPALKAAALDAFFLHLRNLIEFLVKKPRNDKPPMISRWDYVKGFSLDNALLGRLDDASHFASTQVAHFNATARVPTESAPITYWPSQAELDCYVDDVFAAFGALVQYLAKMNNEYAADFEGWLREARRRRHALQTLTHKAAPLVTSQSPQVRE